MGRKEKGEREVDTLMYTVIFWGKRSREDDLLLKMTSQVQKGIVRGLEAH